MLSVGWLISGLSWSVVLVLVTNFQTLWSPDRKLVFLGEEVEATELEDWLRLGPDIKLAHP